MSLFRLDDARYARARQELAVLADGTFEVLSRQALNEGLALARVLRDRIAKELPSGVSVPTPTDEDEHVAAVLKGEAEEGVVLDAADRRFSAMADLLITTLNLDRRDDVGAFRSTSSAVIDLIIAGRHADAAAEATA